MERPLCYNTPMSLTYKILDIRDKENETDVFEKCLKELDLTDLNSDGAFHITTVIVSPKTKPKDGTVIKGPENWLSRGVVLSHKDGTASVKDWKVGDHLIDENPINH